MKMKLINIHKMDQDYGFTVGNIYDCEEGSLHDYRVKSDKGIYWHVPKMYFASLTSPALPPECWTQRDNARIDFSRITSEVIGRSKK